LIEIDHRGVKCHRTVKGFWVFAKPPDGWSHWSRFFTDEETNLLDPKSELSMDLQKIIITKAIDRMVSSNPVYGGDIRFQHKG